MRKILKTLLSVSKSPGGELQEKGGGPEIIYDFANVSIYSTFIATVAVVLRGNNATLIVIVNSCLFDEGT